MMNCRSVSFPIVLGLFVFVIPNTIAQSANIPSATGSLNEGFTYPQISQHDGQKDAVAVALIQSYIAQVNPDRDAELCGTGLITFGTSKESQLALSLSIDGHGKSRLDLTEPTGVRSIRMSGLSGGVVYEDNSVRSFPASMSAAGLFPTASQLSRLLIDPSVTLRDDGNIVVGPEQYHSLTYERRLLSDQTTSSLIPPLVTQLLFDPSTGLLVKAVDVVVLSDTLRSKHLRVIAYADYQKQDTALVPMQFSESRDGQPIWQISLSQIQKNCSHPSSFFGLTGGAQ